MVWEVTCEHLLKEDYSTCIYNAIFIKYIKKGFLCVDSHLQKYIFYLKVLLLVICRWTVELVSMTVNVLFIVTEVVLFSAGF